MEYAARLPRIPSRRTMLAPVVALALGAAAATGAYALVDDGGGSAQAAKVIVVETPAQGSADIPGKNETLTAGAISPAASVSSTDEAATAAAISPRDNDPTLRGSNAGVSLRNP